MQREDGGEEKNAPDLAETAPITAALTGILQGDWDLEQVKDQRMREKYGISDE